jgi:ribonuclease P protein component
VGSFTFGRERRIRRRADFVRVQSNGERATSRHFVLLVSAREVAPNEDGLARAPSRLGIVATRKVGNATVRNRIKRLCRECFRLWPGFVPDGIDLVVIAREGAHELTLDHVRDEWSRARPALLKRCASVLAGGRPPTTARPASATKAPNS